MNDVISSVYSGVTAMIRSIEHARKASIIVFGNEKGGTGKSTAAMHVIIGLLREGYQVGAIDLDAAQGTLTQYFRNRRNYTAQHNLPLPQPLYSAIDRSVLSDMDAAEQDERKRLAHAISAMSNCDYIVLDTPGSDSNLSREGHFHADILITPLNDSFVDLDLIGHIDFDTHKLLEPSHYSEMVWEQKKRRLQSRLGPMDWVVMRNRLASLESRNNRNMELALTDVSERLGLRLIPGLSERVIFRELYLKGLTLLDLRDDGVDISLSLSHVAALQELRDLLREIGI